MYGNPEVTTGGKALKFYASVRIDIRKGEPIKNGSEIIGSRTKIKIVKNKVAPPFRTCTVDMLYGEGISRAGGLLDLATERGLIEKSGSWYSYKDQRIGQGRDSARKYLEDNPEVYAELEEKIRADFNAGNIVATMEPDAAEEDDDEDDEDLDL